MGESAEVVVVGGGIAGSSLATVLAREGYRVVVLERQTAYRDKVRGEVMPPWGVAELHRLGLAEPLLDAGGCYVKRGVSYDELTEPVAAEAAAVRLDRMVPGVAGNLDVGHPEACEALSRAATAAGATVVRGIGSVEVTPGDVPVVRYAHDDRVHELRCRLVVGADGRTSTVRSRLGITLHQSAPRTMCGGLLVDDLHDWPADQLSEGTEADLHYYVLPRANGRARLYLLHDIAQKGRFAGPDRNERFLTAFRFRCIPGSEMFGAARPVRPCAFHPMNDGWTDQPYAPGVVLIGDAAGWSDPIIGQGLSLALRDVRTVTDILRGESDWSPAAFTGYGEERAERLRRLRTTAQVKTDLVATFTPAGAARRRAYNAIWESDPELAGPQIAPLVGPDNVAAELFSQSARDRILALA
ncbi:2-polyprenyl-6-methoxyphenol hydroxylase-like FAD-dependent oxidoreductase [Saccharothrix tamanrassetensis]|uniref:2-polyprenyl-6-methoxyphenol hydroxylase-like FAD-dependent oxidoreductase n=1 Tax=Saccharothrix tamanrassetensis TaxID=1051531 RepID=A0A841CMD5_9PSEU|nr:FAD-dependent oxidoreductase [Saccharothrix tamanrassetensis]MBB5957308.1 2-polyprenyl-6-methoxyphenol hydroxylase-like FAD-dependent oxidoreductase [Saccharothrix tamanrassetensis]